MTQYTSETILSKAVALFASLVCNHWIPRNMASWLSWLRYEQRKNNFLDKTIYCIPPPL